MSTPTSTAAATLTPGQDFKVADLSLAAFGRKEIRLAEHEMPDGDWLAFEQDKHQQLLTSES